jgi:hypothetical protein
MLDADLRGTGKLRESVGCGAGDLDAGGDRGGHEHAEGGVHPSGDERPRRDRSSMLRLGDEDHLRNGLVADVAEAHGPA